MLNYNFKLLTFLAGIFVGLHSCDHVQDDIEPLFHEQTSNNDLINFSVSVSYYTNNLAGLSWTRPTSATSFDIIVNDTLTIPNIINNYYEIQGLRGNCQYKITIRAFNKNTLTRAQSILFRTKKDFIEDVKYISFPHYEFSRYEFCNALSTNDKGYFLLGDAEQYNQGYKLLVKIDSDFNMQWYTIIPTNDVLHWSYRLDQDIIECKDGSFLVKTSNKYIIHILQTGKVNWINKDLVSNNSKDVSSGTELLDGNFMMVGYSFDYAINASYYYLMKLNRNGSLIWEKSFGPSKRSRGRQVYELPNGKKYLYGFTNLGFTLVDFDNNGNMGNEIIYPFPNYSSAYYMRYSQNNLYLIGMTNQEFGETNIIKVNDEGKILWSYNDLGEYSNSSPYSCKILNDTSLLVLTYHDWDNYKIKEFDCKNGTLKSSLWLFNFPSFVYADKDDKGHYIYITKQGELYKINPDGYQQSML